jgi:hypothetical protein
VEKRILRIPVHPTAVIVAVSCSVLALLMMLVMSPFFILMSRVASSMAPGQEVPLPGLGAGMGAMLLFMPVMYFIMMYVTTAIMLLVFNFIAPKLGGIPVIVADEV